MALLEKVMSFQTSGLLIFELASAGRQQHLATGVDVRDGQLESIDGVAVFLVQRPGNSLVQGLNWCLCLFGDMSHNQMYGLALVVSFFALDHVFGGHTSLRKINVTFLTQESVECVIAYRKCKRVAVRGRQHGGYPVPFSLSTRSTTTTSLRPTLMSFWILRIRLRDSSESRIMPSMLSYSRSLT